MRSGNPPSNATTTDHRSSGTPRGDSLYHLNHLNNNSSSNRSFHQTHPAGNSNPQQQQEQEQEQRRKTKREKKQYATQAQGTFSSFQAGNIKRRMSAAAAL
jgi:hypothetical protein